VGYSHQGTAFLASLGCSFVANNTQNVGTMTGVSGTVGEDFVFPFTPNTDANYSVDEIGSLFRHIAFNSDGGYSRTIAYSGYNYSAITTAPILGGMEDTENNTKADLIERYLGYLLKIDGVFRGVVTDTYTSDPIQNATVNIGIYSGTTNQYGLCAIEVPPGSYAVSCTHPNYANFVYPSEIIIEYNDTYWMEIEMNPNVSIDDNEFKDQIARIYPNPCTSHSAIEFYVKTAGNIDIALYNILGQRVSTIIHDYLEPGYHEVSFDNTLEERSKLTSGIYFMKLSSDTHTSVQKLLIVE